MLRLDWARTVCLIALVTTSVVLRNVECATAPEPGDLRGVGKVTFPITCAPDVQSDFARGVALLHSFFYEEARRVFTSVAERDPKCAMAQWGIAMTWWHPIWTPPNPDEMRAGKAAIEKAMSMNAGSDRERGFITALNTYYNTAGQFERSSGWTIVSRSGRTARSGSRLRESNAATARQVSGRFRSADLLRLRGARRWLCNA